MPATCLVPLPVSVLPGTGAPCRLVPGARVRALGPGARAVAELLAAGLGPGLRLSVSDLDTNQDPEPDREPDLRLVVDPGADPRPESYALDVDAAGVRLTAATAEGLFRGVQTVLQLVPIGDPVLAPVHVVDHPRLRYRAAMLDVARRFVPVEDVLRFVDQVAAYKVNTLHLHLSDDQGWRITVDELPELTAVGGSTQAGWPPGSGAPGERWWYSRDDYARIVAHAAARYVEVVPEIDGPGHTLAAQASLGRLSADGVPGPPYWGFEVLNPMIDLSEENRPAVRAFLRTVLSTVAEQSPGRYLHLGGDEVPDPPDGWYEAYTAMANEVVTSLGRTVVAWHQWADGSTLPAGSLVQYWGTAATRSDLDADGTNADERLLRRALAAGADVVMSPADRCYLDLRYDDRTAFGQDWAGLVDLRRAYDWDPVAELRGADGAPLVPPVRVVGLAAPLWADRAYHGSHADPENLAQYPPARDYLDRMAFPRLPALAEVAWTQQSLRAYDDFATRLAGHGSRWDAAGIGWYRSPDVAWH